jgi:phage-related protein
MADLGNVVFVIQADTSKLDDVVTAVGKVESAVNNLQSTFNSMGSNASNAANKASGSTDELSSALKSAAAQGELFADAIENAFSKVIDLAKSAAEAFTGLVEDSVQSYASFEQAYGAADRFYKASETGAAGGKGVMEAYNSELEKSGHSFNEIGISMNEYYQLTNTLMPRLAKDTAEARVKAEYQAQGGIIETVEVRKNALDSELSALKANLSQQYNEQKAAYSADEKEYKASLNQKYEDDKEYWDKQITLFKRNNEDIYDAQKEEFAKQDEQLKQQLDDELTAFKQAKSDEYDALKDSLQAQYDAEKQARSNALAQFKENLNEEYNSLKDSLDAQYDLLKSNLDKQVEAKKKANDKSVDERQKQLDKEYSALQRSLDKEVSAFQRATDARVKEINREYTEKLKLIDEEKYNALKAIDDQIDAIDRQAEEEERAAKLREYNDKLEQHKRAMNNSTCTAERIAAEEAYQKTLAEMQAYTAKNEQADQKENLRKQREEVSRHYDQLKTEVKEEQSEEVDQYKTQRSEELESLRNHNKDILAEKKQANKDAIQAMKDANAEEIADLKETNAEILREAKDNNEGLLREKKNANSALIRQQQEDDQAYLKAIQNDNEATLKEVKRANDAEIKDKQRANKEILDNQKDDHDKQLKQLQRDLADDLEEYKSNVDDVLDEKKRQYDTDYENYQEYHRKMLEELKEYNRVYAEQETQKTKSAKKELSEDDWKVGLDFTPTAQDYDRAMSQVDRLVNNIADATAATDKSNITTSILGGLYGRYATFDELNLPYRNKTGVQQMIEDAYAATRDSSTWNEELFGVKGDPFAGLELSADNASAYLTALTWALNQYGYSGIAAEEATTTLSGAWRSLEADKENLLTVLSMSEEEMERWGVSLDSIIDETMEHLNTFLFGNGVEDKGSEEYFGGLVNKVTDVLNNISSTIAKEKDKEGGVVDQLAKMFGAAGGLILTALEPVIEQIKAFFREKAAIVVNEFLDSFKENIPPEWAENVNTIIDVFKNVKAIIEELKPLIEGVFALTIVADAIVKIKNVGDAFGGVVKAFEIGSTTIGTIFSGISSGITGAFEVLGSGGGVRMAIQEFLTWVAMGFGADAPAAVAIAKFAGPAAIGILLAANEDVQRIVGEVFGNLATVIGGALDACSPILDTFKIVFEGVEGAISAVVQALETLLRPAFDRISEFMSPVMEDIGGKFKKAWEDLNDAITKIGDYLGRLFGPALQDLAKLLSPVAEGIGMIVGYLGAGFLGILDGIVTLFGGFCGWLKDIGDILEATEDPWGTFIGFMEGLPEAIGTAMTEAGAAILGFLDQVKSDITGYFEKAGDWLINTGKDLIGGLVSGAKEKWKEFSEWFTNLPDSVVKFFTEPLEINSPSRVFHRIGGNVIEGFQEGSEEAWGPVSQFFQGLLGAVDSYVEDPVGTLLNAGAEVINGFQNGVNGQWPTIQGFFGGINGEIGGYFNGSDAWLDTYGKQMMDNYGYAIDTAFQATRNFFGQIDSTLGTILANSDKYLTDEGKQVIAGLKSGMDDKYKNITGMFGKMKSDFTGYFNNSSSWLDGKGKDTMGGFHTGLKGEWGSIEVYLGGRGSSVQAQFNGSGTWLNNAGENIMIGLYNGLVNAWNNGDITSFISDIASWIVENKGPESKDKALLVPAGGWIMGGLYSGLEDAFTDDVMPFVESIATEMKEGFDDTLETTRMFLTKMDMEFKRFATSGSELLTEAGADIMDGFMRGLERGWESGREFFLNITDWIQSNKGPKQKDLNLLVPAGNWIMGGLRSGLEDAFRRDVMPFVESMADEMERGFGDPMLMASTGIDGDGYSRSYGAPQVIVQHMEVRSERDIHKVSRELNELWRMEASGSLI